MPAKIEKVWLCYGGCHFNGRENGHVTEVASLWEGAWSCYRGGHFNGGKMVLLQLVSVGRENGYVTD